MFVQRSRFFTVRPRVQRRGRQLSVTTSWLVQAFTAFAYRREVNVDEARRAIVIVERTFWLRRRVRLVRFSEVARVTYSFASAPTSWDFTGRAHDSVEAFTVGVELQGSGETVNVARFVGEGAEGSVVTWLLGDDLLDVEGTQEDDSRALVTELCRRIGVGLGPALQPIVDPSGRAWVCGRCGRQVAPKPKCLYCGGETAPR
jgi:hypothetical protein